MAGWLVGWIRRDIWEVTNTGEEDIVEGVVTFNLDASNFDFASARNDGEDLRFVTTDGTLLSHNIEHYDFESQTATIHVKLPPIEAGESMTIYLFYGNKNATWTSDETIVPGSETLTLTKKS